MMPLDKYEQAGKAEDAIKFYTSIFEDSAIRGILRYNKDEPEVEGTVKYGQFNLGKHLFMFFKIDKRVYSFFSLTSILTYGANENF